MLSFDTMRNPSYLVALRWPAVVVLAGVTALSLVWPAQAKSDSSGSYGALASSAARFHDCGGAGEPGTDNVVFVKARRIRCAPARRIIGRWVRGGFTPSGGPKGWRCRGLRPSPRGETRWLCLRGSSGLRLRFPCFGSQCEISLIPGLRPCPTPRVYPPKRGGFGLIISRLEVRRISCPRGVRIAGANSAGESLPRGWMCAFAETTGETQCQRGRRILTYSFEGTAS